ncbi:LysR family transcriptional regulator [Salinisphaera hydrothermalis]|uniref:LysR family transcriptional regulator n=1 Tax=Salinisphaera hydrothermalis TaxID=563188 RepID=UPI0033413A1F
MALVSRTTLLNRLRYKHLLLIRLLDERRNLHRVAEAMNISQPAATRMLREIETTFDSQLFTRDAKGVTPTRLGSVLIQFAHNALTRLDRCAEELQRYRSGDGGELAIGAIMGAAPDLVAEAVIEMKQDRPLLRIRLMGETSDQLLDLLSRSQIDMAIARFSSALQHNEFDFEPLGNERMIAVVRRDHALVNAPTPPLADLLEDWPWLLQPVETPARQALEKELEQRGLVSPRDVVECGSIFAALQLVKRSDAILVMAESVVRDYLEFGVLTALPVSLGEALAPFGILTRRGERLSEAGHQFAAVVRRHAAARAPSSVALTE